MDLIRRVLAENRINIQSILDVGANKGEWSESAGRCWPDVLIHMIEGNEECSWDLYRSGLPYSIAVLSHSHEDRQLWVSKVTKGCTGASLYREVTDYYTDDKAEARTVKTTTLDLLLEGKTFDLIKVDVQGAELDVLKGGPKTVNKAKALILEVSLEEYNKGAPLEDEVVSYVHSLGFRTAAEVGRHWQMGRLIQKDLLFVR